MNESNRKDLIEENIWLCDGTIVIDSRLNEVDKDLISCIEDNIYEEDGEEYVNWSEVWRDYDKCKIDEWNKSCKS